MIFAELDASIFAIVGFRKVLETCSLRYYYFRNEVRNDLKSRNSNVTERTVRFHVHSTNHMIHPESLPSRSVSDELQHIPICYLLNLIYAIVLALSIIITTLSLHAKKHSV